MNRPRLVLEPGLYAVIHGAVFPSVDPLDGCLRADLAAAGEQSAVRPEAEVPEGMAAERGWRWLRVVGPLDFSAVGILAGIAAPLAREGVSIFVLSTYETDHLLLREADLDRAVEALQGEGYRIEGDLGLARRR